MDISNKLIEFALGEKDIPASASHILNLSLLDWVSVSLSGVNEPVSRIVRECFLEEGGNPEAFVLGSNKKAPSRVAALVNGTISHALDYDDTHFASLGHPSVAVMPAALAISDRVDSDLEAFKRASLIGMEVATRVGVWLGRGHYRKGFHVTATAGTFGATVTAGLLLGLNERQFKMALGLAASRAAGIKAQFGTMGKPFHAGTAASNGVEASLLASRGFVSAEDGFGGPQGFGRTHHSEDNTIIFDTLGSEYIFEGVSHKFHACCHGLHAGMEALIELRDKNFVKSKDVEEIEITVHPQYLNVCNILSPETGLEAKFSYRFTAAMVMHGVDTARLESFSDISCRDFALTETCNKVLVRTDPELSETSAKVNLRIKSGESLTNEYDLANLTNPAKREAKVLTKSNSLLGKNRTKEIWSFIATEQPNSIPVSKALFDYS